MKLMLAIRRIARMVRLVGMRRMVVVMVHMRIARSMGTMHMRIVRYMLRDDSVDGMI